MKRKNLMNSEKKSITGGTPKEILENEFLKKTCRKSINNRKVQEYSKGNYS